MPENGRECPNARMPFPPLNRILYPVEGVIETVVIFNGVGVCHCPFFIDGLVIILSIGNWIVAFTDKFKLIVFGFNAKSTCLLEISVRLPKVSRFKPRIRRFQKNVTENRTGTAFFLFSLTGTAVPVLVFE